jgi:hypothetical protein
MNTSDFLRLLSLGLLEDTKMTWQDKYEFVFSHDFKQLIVSAIGGYRASNIQWLDPDGSYEEDTKAYIKTVLELV